jgi:hypothetical protein
MKKTDVKSIILIIYLQLMLILYFWLIFPSLTKPKDLAPTEIPVLSVTEIREVNLLFTNKGKESLQQPSEPNLSNYTFGQADPI